MSGYCVRGPTVDTMLLNPKPEKNLRRYKCTFSKWQFLYFITDRSQQLYSVFLPTKIVNRNIFLKMMDASEAFSYL